MEVKDLAGFGEVLNSEVANKTYDHALAGAAKETGECATDVAKTFRLLLAPFQLAALAQDRFAKWLDRIRNRVPVERQIEAAPSIAGPAIRAMVFLEDDNPLLEMFLNLLTKAIDKEHVEETHPAFVQVLSQLSPDEATIIAMLYRDGWYAINYGETYIAENDFPLQQLHNPSGFAMATSHLKALGIVTVARQRETYAQIIGPPEYLTRYEPLGAGKLTVQDLVYLTVFGRSFAAACTPSEYHPTAATAGKLEHLQMMSGFSPEWIIH